LLLRIYGYSIESNTVTRTLCFGGIRKLFPDMIFDDFVRIERTDLVVYDTPSRKVNREPPPKIKNVNKQRHQSTKTGCMQWLLRLLNKKVSVIYPVLIY